MNENTQNDILSIDIRALNFSIRTRNVLLRSNVETIGDLCKVSEEEVKRFRNMGAKSLQEVKDKLSEYGLALGMGDKENIAKINVQLKARILLLKQIETLQNVECATVEDTLKVTEMIKELLKILLEVQEDSRW